MKVLVLFDDVSLFDAIPACDRQTDGQTDAQPFYIGQPFRRNTGV